MEIKQRAIAGSIESSDVMIIIEPFDKIDVQITSPFIKQYGHQIDKLIRDELKKSKIEKAKVIVQDQGALNGVIKARLTTAINRSQGKEVFDFE